VATSLATIVVTSVSSARSHYKCGTVDLDLLRAWGPWIVVGVVLGTVLANLAKGWVMTLVFGIVALLVAINMITLSVPILTAFGFDIKRSVGTAAAIGFLIAVPATLGYIIGGWSAPDRPPFSIGYVNLIAFMALVPLRQLRLGQCLVAVLQLSKTVNLVLAAIFLSTSPYTIVGRESYYSKCSL